jgi:DNA-binding response OmpR family regulator
MKDVLKRVLLVEDEVDAREVISIYLDSMFDVVDVASTGQEGYDKFIENSKKGLSYDVIITDIKMPEKDGLTMLEEIVKEQEDQKFIIVSAHKDEEYLFRSINLNVIGYFTKPLVVEKLIEALKKVIKQSSKDTLIQLNDTYQYDGTKKLLYDGGETIYLSKKESLLMDFLINHRGEIKTNQEIKLAVWDDDSTADATLRTLFKRVKDKIIKNDFILSKKGRGYIIE